MNPRILLMINQMFGLVLAAVTVNFAKDNLRRTEKTPDTPWVQRAAFGKNQIDVNDFFNLWPLLLSALIVGGSTRALSKAFRRSDDEADALVSAKEREKFDTLLQEALLPYLKHDTDYVKRTLDTWILRCETERPNLDGLDYEKTTKKKELIITNVKFQIAQYFLRNFRDNLDEMLAQTNQTPADNDFAKAQLSATVNRHNNLAKEKVTDLRKAFDKSLKLVESFAGALANDCPSLTDFDKKKDQWSPAYEKTSSLVESYLNSVRVQSRIDNYIEGALALAMRTPKGAARA